MHTWASDRSVSAEVAERIREIAQRQLDRLDEVTATAQAAVVRVAPLLAEDPALYAESLASTRANTARFLMLMASDPLEPIPSDPPAEAVDIARSVMRRGADTEMVVLTYRAGQNVFWESWIDAAAELVPDRDELVEVLRVSSVLVPAYTDGVLATVLARAEEERDELLRGGRAGAPRPRAWSSATCPAPGSAAAGPARGDRPHDPRRRADRRAARRRAARLRAIADAHLRGAVER